MSKYLFIIVIISLLMKVLYHKLNLSNFNNISFSLSTNSQIAKLIFDETKLPEFLGSRKVNFINFTLPEKCLFLAAKR